MGVCNCSMLCCTLLYVHSSIAIILMGKRELIALLNLSSSWCLVMVERLFLALPRGCLQFVIVVFPDHTHLLFLNHDRWLQGHIDNSKHTLPSTGHRHSLCKIWTIFIMFIQHCKRSLCFEPYRRILVILRLTFDSKVISAIQNPSKYLHTNSNHCAKFE